MKGQLKINQLFAFIIVDDDGTEGVPAIQAGAVMMPLMGADMARVDSLKTLIEGDPAFRGRRLTICRFGHREVIGTIDRTRDAAPPSITCPRCSGVSYHPKDIAERYCGACHQFHDAPAGAP